MTSVRKIEQVRVDYIDVPKNRRPISKEAIKPLTESMQRIGLQTPITVRYWDNHPANGTDDSYVLVTGHHRLAVAKTLGWEKIDCFVVDDGDDSNDPLWEISENLHRAELSVLERDEQIAKWVHLTEQRRISVQPAPKLSAGRPESGTSAAARELGIEETDAKRAVKVASLAPEAKQAARDAGLDDNRTALLAAAKYTETEQQVQSLLKRPPVDWLKIAAKKRRRMLREIVAIIVQHVPDEHLPELKANLVGYGQPLIAAAIVRAAKERRQ